MSLALLLCGKRYRSIPCCTTRQKDGIHPKTVRILNSSFALKLKNSVVVKTTLRLRQDQDLKESKPSQDQNHWRIFLWFRGGDRSLVFFQLPQWALPWRTCNLSSVFYCVLFCIWIFYDQVAKLRWVKKSDYKWLTLLATFEEESFTSNQSHYVNN